MKTELQQIARKLITVVTVDSLDQTLATQAAEVLGYQQPPSSEVACWAKPLAAVLAELKLEVLDREQVGRYQLGKWKEEVQAEVERWLAEARLHDDRPSLSEWWQTRIDSHDEAIPEFVLRKAVAVKRRLLDDVRVRIEALRLSPDRFLLVAHRFSGEEYYLDFWAEPKFEGTLTLYRPASGMPAEEFEGERA